MRNRKQAPPKTKGRVRFRRGDAVVVIAGADKGKKGEVVKVLADEGRVLVQGVNVRTKHLKKSQENPQGGVRKVESPIDASNVLLYSEKAKKGVRVRYEDRDGKKTRVGSCGTVFE